MIDSRINPNDKYIIFHSEGGHGKQVMSTAVIRAIKKQYPDRKIIVVTAWDAPFFYNPDVWRFYTFGQMQYFFDDYIKEDTMIFRQEVYHTEDYILKENILPSRGVIYVVLSMMDMNLKFI